MKTKEEIEEALSLTMFAILQIKGEAELKSLVFTISAISWILDDSKLKYSFETLIEAMKLIVNLETVYQNFKLEEKDNG